MAGKIFDMAANTHRDRPAVIEIPPFEYKWGTSIAELMDEAHAQITLVYAKAIEPGIHAGRTEE